MLIELARGLGIETVAEGVETEEVAAWLRGARVDYMQGYYFGKPALERPASKRANGQRGDIISSTLNPCLPFFEYLWPLRDRAGFFQSVRPR